MPLRLTPATVALRIGLEDGPIEEMLAQGGREGDLTVHHGESGYRTLGEGHPGCACGSSGAAVCGAGGVMAWERGRGEGARGRGGR